MAIAEYMEYAKERGRWWVAKYPSLRDDIIATALLALVQALDTTIPLYPKAFISKCIDNAMVTLLENNYIIHVPRSEIQRRKMAKESLDNLPRAMTVEDEELWDLRRSQEPPPWTIIQLEDIAKLLELTERERRILTLRIQGYSNSEIGTEYGITKQAIQKTLQLVKGRYLTLLQTHWGLLQPHE